MADPTPAHHEGGPALLCEPSLGDLDSDNTLLSTELEHDEVNAQIPSHSPLGDAAQLNLEAMNTKEEVKVEIQSSSMDEDGNSQSQTQSVMGLPDSQESELDSGEDEEDDDNLENGGNTETDSPHEPSETTKADSACQMGCQMRPYYIIHTGQGRVPPSDYEEFECPQAKCQFIFPTASDRDEHVAAVHKPPVRVPCHVCDKTFARKYELQIHVKTIHLNIKDNVCPEIGCDYRTAEKGKIKKHLEQKHWGVKNFKCRQCSYKSTSGSSLRNHVKAVHLKLREFKCEYCEYRGAQKNQVQRHMEAIHLNLRQYQCPECDYRANHESTVKTHIKNRHQVVRDHLCPHCGYGTTNKTQLEQHIEKKHRNPKRRKTKPIYVSGYRLKEPLPPNLAQSQM